MRTLQIEEASSLKTPRPAAILRSENCSAVSRTCHGTGWGCQRGKLSDRKECRPPKVTAAWFLKHPGSQRWQWTHTLIKQAPEGPVWITLLLSTGIYHLVVSQRFYEPKALQAWAVPIHKVPGSPAIKTSGNVMHFTVGSASPRGSSNLCSKLQEWKSWGWRPRHTEGVAVCFA